MHLDTPTLYFIEGENKSKEAVKVNKLGWLHEIKITKSKSTSNFWNFREMFFILYQTMKKWNCDFFVLWPTFSSEMGTGSDLDIKRIPEKEVKDALNRMKAIKHWCYLQHCFWPYTTMQWSLVIPNPSLTSMVEMFLHRDSVPNFILVCTLSPIVKDSLGNITSSGNYINSAISNWHCNPLTGSPSCVHGMGLL